MSPSKPVAIRTAVRPHPTISDVALALAQRSNPPQSKVSLTRNAKGDVQIEVEVGDTDPQKAAATCETIFVGLCDRFPRVNGGES